MPLQADTQADLQRRIRYQINETNVTTQSFSYPPKHSKLRIVLHKFCRLATHTSPQQIYCSSPCLLVMFVGTTSFTGFDIEQKSQNWVVSL